MTSQIFFEPTVQSSDGGVGRSLLAERFVEQVSYLLAVFRGESGNPMLFDRIAFIASEAVESFEMRDVRTHGCGKRSERLVQQRTHLGAAFLMHMIAGNQRTEMRSMEQRFVALTDSGMTGDQLRLFDEPSLALIGGFDEKGGFIK